MLHILADAMMIAARQNPFPQPTRHQPKNPEADLATRRRWFDIVGIRL